mmetsp:Transcript_44878/g.91616  ORF Transcript_44878/g.91616 Transcript_44878/m.91616 type:complete len:288 (+) Transcript_44878:50-913(+)|eukprot:CAMPEP_0181307698 /NCGR_PEP_ID=MMETSP1101-20121128/11032_1 /TAXON_ID=46948 /ORGANISM="Rhodomonas abbreviata, Strain Caron Lab Isolate" /LENGTH=287 /DNA_ID=CAMNT_0023413959 /DNA_START=281 /DNA_END=1144 /DNA_ORIENTATION=+
MAGEVRCCDYKTARRSLIVLNLIDFVFCIVFIGVGAVSLAYSQGFNEQVGDYCVKQCHLEEYEATVGCNCDVDPPSPTIPSYVFQSPAIGLIVVGVFSLFKVVIGCFAAIRENYMLLMMYMCCLIMIILLQFGFGAAAAAVSTARSADITGPIYGLFEENYKLFDWKSLDDFFPSECYIGLNTVDGVDYHHPLCTFKGECVREPFQPTPAEEECCNGNFDCDSGKDNCISGEDCMKSFFNKVGAPVAVAAFLSLIIQFAALGFACAIRTGTMRTSKQHIGETGVELG